jgi:signal transduction histidine kinase
VTHPDRLIGRVYRWQLGFSVGAGLCLGWAVPLLLQLSGSLSSGVRFWLFTQILIGSGLTTVTTWFSMRRYRFLLQALSLDRREGSTATLDPTSVANFAHEPGRLTGIWLVMHSASLCILLAPFRPDPLDWTAAVTVVLLSTLMLATTSLPMHVLVRHDFLEVLELAPEKLMRSVIRQFERVPAARGRINRRIVIAVATPVSFVALGSALIVNAHLRRDDEVSRAETARTLARAALELKPGTVDGLERALAKAERLGFPAQISSPQARYGVILERSGIAELTTPLDTGSASVRFDASTVEVLSPAPVIVSLLATVAAAILGYLLGNLLSTDLYYATRGVRLLGATPAARHQHTGVLRAPRLKLIADLGAAIDALTARFAVFAQAQETAIDARATAVRARGLFFASVSHDLKAPLNSILGFTHVVEQQPLSQGQLESLHAIHSRAQELLALIETILDAARVEEGHLSLMTDEVSFKQLFDKAIDTARQLSSSYEAQIFEEIEEGIPALIVDRTRVTRALATLIAYSIRTNQGGKMWIRAERESESRMRLDVDVPKPAHSPKELELMLSPSHDQPGREHRGLSLGLRLARSVVKLHRGSVRVVDRGKKGAMFCVQLPTVSAPLPTASAPLHSIPAPPSSRPPSSLPPPLSIPPLLTPSIVPGSGASTSSLVPTTPSVPPRAGALARASTPPGSFAPAVSSMSGLVTPMISGRPGPSGPDASTPAPSLPPLTLSSVVPTPPSGSGLPAAGPAPKSSPLGRPPLKPATRKKGPPTEGQSWFPEAPPGEGPPEFDSLQPIPRPPRLPTTSAWLSAPPWPHSRRGDPVEPAETFTYDTPSESAAVPPSKGPGHGDDGDSSPDSSPPKT